MGQKALAVVQILKILKEHSDKDHLLTHKNIVEYLENEYGIVIERKAVARHLQNLSIAGYDIVQTPKGAYLEDDRDFDDSELRLLIDSVLFSRHISEKYATKLIEKLQKLGSIELRRQHGAIYRASQVVREDLSGLFYIINMIDEAICGAKKISFIYNEYHLDKKLYPVFDKEIELSPYQLVARAGHYYVIGRLDDIEKMESFRVEKITDIKILEEKQNSAVGPSAADVAKYLAEHPYMYSGEKAEITLTINSRCAGKLIDAFGFQFNVLKEENGKATISLQAGFTDMFEWAKRFAEDVEVISPQSLRDSLRQVTFPAAGKYFHSEEDRYVQAIEHLTQIENKPEEERILHFDGIDLSQRHEYKNFTSCKFIELRNNNLSDFNFLSAFHELSGVDIERNPVSDLSALKGKEGIKTIILKDTAVTDLSFLDGMTKLTAFEFKGEKVKDISPVYSCFGLQRMIIDSVNAMQFDLMRLKRSCPNLQVKLEEFDGVPTLAEGIEFFGEGDIDILFEITREFAVRERNPAEILEKEEVDLALSYIKTHDFFYQEDMQKELHLSYQKAAALTNWMEKSAYLERCKNNRLKSIIDRGEL